MAEYTTTFVTRVFTIKKLTLFGIFFFFVVVVYNKILQSHNKHLIIAINNKYLTLLNIHTLFK